MGFIIDWLFVSASSLAPIVASTVAQAAQTTSLNMQTAWIAAGASLIGALIGALIPALMAFFQNKSSREDERGFLAVHVAAALYTYASSCVDVMYDAGEPDEQGRVWIVVLSPTFSPLEQDVNWRSISVELLDRIFAIPSAQRIVNERLRWEAENEFEYPILARQIAYGRLAMKALAIAHDLRRSGGLPPDPDGVIDLVSQLKEHIPKLEQKEAEIERSREASWSSLLNEAKPIQ